MYQEFTRVQPSAAYPVLEIRALCPMAKPNAPYRQRDGASLIADFCTRDVEW
jgi:hypothetical protein